MTVILGWLDLMRTLNGKPGFYNKILTLAVKEVPVHHLPRVLEWVQEVSSLSSYKKKLPNLVSSYRSGKSSRPSSFSRKGKSWKVPPLPSPNGPANRLMTQVSQIGHTKHIHCPRHHRGRWETRSLRLRAHWTCKVLSSGSASVASSSSWKYWRASNQSSVVKLTFLHRSMYWKVILAGEVLQCFIDLPASHSYHIHKEVLVIRWTQYYSYLLRYPMAIPQEFYRAQTDLQPAIYIRLYMSRCWVMT